VNAATLAADIAAAQPRLAGGLYSLEALLSGPNEVYEALLTLDAAEQEIDEQGKKTP
jgi:hypothetical protein